MSDIVTLYQVARGDRFRFVRCPPMRMCSDGSLRYETWRDRWASALAEVFWPSGSVVVTHIDRSRGIITVGDR